MSEPCPAIGFDTIEKMREACKIYLGYNDTRQYTVIGVQTFDNHKAVLVKWNYSGDLNRIRTPCSHIMFDGKDITPTLIAINDKVTTTNAYNAVKKIMINSNYDVPVMVDSRTVEYNDETIGTAVCYGIILDYGHDVAWQYAP